LVGPAPDCVDADSKYLRCFSDPKLVHAVK